MKRPGFKAVEVPNPYPPGSVAAKGWERGWGEAVICDLFDVPMSLVIADPRGVHTPTEEVEK